MTGLATDRLRGRRQRALWRAFTPRALLAGLGLVLVTCGAAPSAPASAAQVRAAQDRAPRHHATPTGASPTRGVPAARPDPARDDRAAPERAARRWSLGWSVLPAAVGVVDVAVERHLAGAWSVRALVGLGRGTTRWWSTREVRGLTLIDGRWTGHVGLQVRRRLWQLPGLRLWAAGSGRWLYVSAPAQPVTGGLAGGLVGVTWVWPMGLTVDAGVGGGLVVSTLVPLGQTGRITSWSSQVIGHVQVGWSF